MDRQSQIDALTKIALEVLAEHPEHDGKFTIIKESSQVTIKGMVPLEIVIKLTKRLQDKGLEGIVSLDCSQLP